MRSCRGSHFLLEGYIFYTGDPQREFSEQQTDTTLDVYQLNSREVNQGVLEMEMTVTAKNAHQETISYRSKSQRTHEV